MVHNARGKLVQFGYIPGVNQSKKPWATLHQTYVKEKNYVYGIKSIDLKISSTQRGNAGARKFYQLEFPPLSYWNPDVRFQYQKLYKIDAPTLTVTMESGKVHEVTVPNLKQKDILAKLLELSQPRGTAQ
ncbi:hypothetical protein PROFUN_02973 [Planoprotostelium fungivorum]|uniref:Ribosomal protein/NADH dehydrogenase domain-containing protein n=1 Tax=Planoprotostelium fungivorum TaxID=1890364 RepID=A0A2P6NX78_9EUKA|nr:hypothetical protein PROFUN_02973 [Planoprotostelium fungivorum]